MESAVPKCFVLQVGSLWGRCSIVPQDTPGPLAALFKSRRSEVNVPPLRPNRHDTTGLLSSGICLAKASGAFRRFGEFRADVMKPTAFYSQRSSFKLRTTCNSKFTHSLNVVSHPVFFLSDMFDCVAEVDAERHTQAGMRARAKPGQTLRETMCLPEKPPPDPTRPALLHRGHLTKGSASDDLFILWAGSLSNSREQPNTD